MKDLAFYFIMCAEINQSINLLAKEDNQQPAGRKIFKFSKILLYSAIILAITFFIFSYQVLFTDNSLVESLGGKFNLFTQLKTLAKGESALAGADNDRINILLLGMGGAGHDGPNLTDTIMFVSIQPSTNKVSMVSIPRDLLVEIPDHGWWKINNANHFGEKQNPGHGGELTGQVVAQILNQPVHYYARIDFAGFERLIDDLGGVKVNVDRGFTDYAYPAPNDKYQVVSFSPGWQTMDGDAALKYVRSRHGNNGEGSDFARSKRQQKVLQAFKERILSYSTFFNPRKLAKLFQAFGDHVRTNLELAEINELANLLEDLDTQNIITEVLDDSPDGYLYAGMVNGAYVLQPRNGNFDRIQFMAENIFTSTHAIAEKPSANMEIKNGTKSTGLAYNTSLKLKDLGFKVLKIGNAPSQDYQTTLIYNLSDDYDAATGNLLKSLFKTEIINNVPDWVREDADLSTNYYIILGEDGN